MVQSVQNVLVQRLNENNYQCMWGYIETNEEKERWKYENYTYVNVKYEPYLRFMQDIL